MRRRGGGKEEKGGGGRGITRWRERPEGDYEGGR